MNQKGKLTMKLLTWNVNHRAKEHKIPDYMAKAIASLSPDVIVLTEYVSPKSCLTASGQSHQKFIKQLELTMDFYIMLRRSG